MVEQGRVAIIPARGGSKRLPGKILKSLSGKTLLAQTVEVLKSSECFERIIVSSDASDILDHAAGMDGIEVRWRPAALASDLATTMDMLIDFLTEPKRHQLHQHCSVQDFNDALLPTDIVGLFQPTSPFRTVEDIISTMAHLNSGFDSVISVVAVSTPPEHCFMVNEQTGHCIIDTNSPLIRGQTRKQAFPPTFAPNGAIYISSAGHIRATRSFYSGRVAAHVMPRSRSLDIDDAYDWQLAECLAAATSEMS